MGVTCWHAYGRCDDLKTEFVSVIAKSIGSSEEDGKSITKTTAVNVNDVESTIEGSTSSGDLTPKSPLMIHGGSENEAAVKLQKVYKSFRTRRKLADCAVLVEHSWWKLLDFVELKRSSISFFDVEKHETAISRWSRALTRAAKVGKGLSKNSKAQKLALQHWLEAIDPRHRYGHNLHFYYAKWFQSQSKEPFFYWLDLGEGKEINLVEKCSRSKLQNQCIKYLGPMERKAYEIELENGKLFKKQTREILDTTGVPNGAKWIFVLSTSRTLYVGRKQKGTFQHSSFLAGGATLAAGQLVVENGTLRAVWPHSGHYRPTEENFKDFISFLRENNVDLTNVQLTPVDEEQISYRRQSSNCEMRSSSSKEDLTQKETCSDVDQINAEGVDKVNINLNGKEVDGDAFVFQKPRKQKSLGKKLTYLEIPTRDEFLQRLQRENQVAASSGNKFSGPPPFDGYESPEEEEEHEGSIRNSLGDVDEKGYRIKERANSHKDSYQLGKQLSCTWTSGVGPRIGCVRDYPTELQKHALEKLNLSPRSAPVSRSRSSFTPKHRRVGTFTPEPLATTADTTLFSHRSLPHYSTLPSPLWKANSLGITSFS